jgi:hypothetical protein
MQNEDFGKELTVKVQSRWTEMEAVHVEPLLCESQSYTQHNIPEWWILHPPGMGGWQW